MPALACTIAILLRRRKGQTGSNGEFGVTYHPVVIDGADRGGRWAVLCDHASNEVPDFVNGGCLGVAPDDMARHIAYDPGAEGVSRALGAMLDGPAILSRFSRLVIDPNRGEEDPTLIMQLYDGTIIPGNRGISDIDAGERLRRCHRPYHDAVAQMAAARRAPVLVSVHSFTPQLRGRPPRPWQIGVLYSTDTRLARPLLARLRAEPDLSVGDNQPYTGHLPGDTIARHGIEHARPNVLIELRNDLIATEAQQKAWAARLAPILIETLADANL
ncbi:Predicted N-formylglutamate amidohydrolase [Roseovarius nanhaiticus]|uniref:Predicted N-formylglutamate amidohydrolase n=1 Tax=Roseovarius nanhaiticus TaxID=573024 RepID=A0A1N7FD25_9RHOB|nr:Predicted N-formylglutamate amidohydrolase [Roseovarius nanhaiticus]SIR98126.1 Predicted N-formylglutamate amidohydrolase [Roseovarius nanhaiticus]